MSNQDLEAQLAALRAENAKLKAAKNPAVSFKVGEKGGVSLYGLSRFPVTLYVQQWEKLFAAQDNLKAFIEEHRSELKTKE